MINDAEILRTKIASYLNVDEKSLPLIISPALKIFDEKSRVLPPGLDSVAFATAIIFCEAPTTPKDPCQLIFLRRSTLVKAHKHEISLPGGKRESCDDGLHETATRETCEEIGVKKENIKVFAYLPLVQAISGHQVLPFVCALRQNSGFQAEPNETEEIFLRPWSDFSVLNHQTFRFNIFGEWHNSSLYFSEGLKVWGLTARVLTSCEFKHQ